MRVTDYDRAEARLRSLVGSVIVSRIGRDLDPGVAVARVYDALDVGDLYPPRVTELVEKGS